METYVDGFVLPIPRDRIEEYRSIARKAGEIWKAYGALAYWESVGDDLGAKYGMVSFERTANAAAGETVVLSWIVFASREERDRINAQVMADPRIREMMEGPPPFDYTRMAYGGFRELVAL